MSVTRRHFFLSAHRTLPLTHTRTLLSSSLTDSLISLELICTLQETITSPSLYFITSPDFQATSQSLEI
ncbi:hypothetical protein NC652_004729 [Populus alba x Populus x berolinensis]|uniref:Uncharacterized protein n=1 Tax=Populus alba x Populus x berolinensis TaxID=444605 RepID=A0AAD6RVJ6_9ROSI|nr:hypothetical protein NC652_004729 [Populus alba x Populus x berolinensis]KAJ7015491.1 hypothetical protein NC653_004706 [Populus alba x Populus x berolinensis]